MWTSKCGHTWALVVLIGACGTKPEGQGVPSHPPVATVPGGPLALTMVDDNVRHDTLLVQVTFDLGDGTHLMVASNVEETFEGLRLYHYRARPDSSAEILHVSAPAYDSWTMLPTLFGEGAGLNDKWVLANFGERESWGQKVMWFQQGFHDRGFMHVALPERMVEEDSTFLRRTNIAPHMRMDQRGDTTFFTFACDSVFLYDDNAGGVDLIVPSSSIRYILHPGAGLILWIDGQPRPTPRPA